MIVPAFLFRKFLSIRDKAYVKYFVNFVLLL